MARQASGRLYWSRSVSTCAQALYKLLIDSDFIDHLMRFTPSQALVAIKRSFFNRTIGQDFKPLGQAVIATKGVYQSLRVAQV